MRRCCCSERYGWCHPLRRIRPGGRSAVRAYPNTSLSTCGRGVGGEGFTLIGQALRHDVRAVCIEMHGVTSERKWVAPAALRAAKGEFALVSGWKAGRTVGQPFQA